MPLTRLILSLFSVLLLMLPMQAKSALIERAYHAYEKKNKTLLNQYTRQLKAQQQPLAPYAEYWQVLLNQKNTSQTQVEQLLNRTEAYAFYPKLQAVLLRKLAKSGQWTNFFNAYETFKGHSEAVDCWYWLGKAKTQEQTNNQVINQLWYSERSRAKDCNVLFDYMIARRVITTQHIHERIRMTLLNGRRSLSKSLALKLPGVKRKTARLVDRVKSNPKRFLTKRVASFNKPFGVNLNLYALDRMARKNPGSAASVLRTLQHRFSAKDKQAAWEVVAYRAARNHHAQALRYYQNAYPHQALPADLQTSDFYLTRNAWRARAALRTENWTTLLETIQGMPEVQQNRARWRYWRARAVKQVYPKQQKILNVANSLLTDLGQERHYYGWLAAEEVQMQKEGYHPQSKPVDEAMVKEIAQQQKIQWAVGLQKAGVHKPAKRAWYHAIKGYSDQKDLAAAVYAQRLGWHDVSINTADRTKVYHDFNLRYAAPFRKSFQQAAASEGLDESWVLGLVRQESRFIDYAKSRVGAAGLMQLMPKTARWVAKKKGMRRPKRHELYQVQTNIKLGTYYMRYTLDLLGGNAVLATAGYNAGPSRALAWMANKPLEGDIYMETIPFDETRNYVQRVMANAHFYAPRVGAKQQTLKQRIGIIPAKHQ